MESTYRTAEELAFIRKIGTFAEATRKIPVEKLLKGYISSADKRAAWAAAWDAAGAAARAAAGYAAWAAAWAAAGDAQEKELTKICELSEKELALIEIGEK